MNCPERARLELFFESALDECEAAEVRRHQAACEACGGLLRRLGEEARSLRKNLPDAALPAEPARLVAAAANVWKPVAIAAVAAMAVLSGALLWAVRRGDPESLQARRNIEASVRRFLAQGEPAKAAAALEAHPGDSARLRLEVAQACPPEEAAKLLDGIVLSSLSRGDAETAARARLDAYRRLFEQKVLRDGSVPAPFDPTPYRMEKTDLPPVEEISRIASKLLERIAERRDLERLDPALARLESLALAVRYALGEIGLDAVTTADDEIRFQLGDLLYRERQFDRAIDTWRPILDDTRVIRKLAELAALRRLAPKTLHVWDYDVQKLLGRNPKVEAEAAARIEGLFKGANPAVLPSTFERPLDITGASEVGVARHATKPERVELALDPTQLYLLVDHTSFRLEVPFERPFLTRAAAAVKLRSSYTGPIRLRLHRVRSLETLRSLEAANIVSRRSELAFVREWETQFAPLREGELKEETWTLEVPPSGPGLFVLLADARYCPVTAVAKFIVTDVALVQQPALDRVLVYAADRLTGAPVPDLPLGGEVTGRYAIRPEDWVPEDDSNSEEYRRGFDASWARKAAEPDATPSYQRGFRRAADLHARNPEVRAGFRGSTGKDGIFEWTVSPEWRAGYQYAIKTESLHAETYTRVESPYALDPKARTLKALVYTDRPLYRPGDAVSFKAILRRLDSEGLHPYDGREALVEFGTSGRVLFARGFQTTDFGTASGAFDLPVECPQGGYWARVNNGPSHPIFRVEEYRKPEFEIILSHRPRVLSGDPVEVEIAARYYTGDPLANAPLSITLSAAPEVAPTVLFDDSGEWNSQAALWRTLETRTLSTDSAGRCTFRFRTDEGVAARYSVTASVREESQREVRRSSSLEATGRTRGVLWEADRPAYHAGEVARLRFHVPGASTLRLEERAKVEKPFSATVALADGAGTCEYPVPEAARDLQVGVREGDAWAWTPIAIRIQPRPGQDGLVNARMDRALYRVGETARLHLGSAEREQHVLVTVATGRIHRRQVVRLSDRRADVPIEVRDEDVPNVEVVALAIHNDRLGKAAASMRVPPVDRFLTVEIRTDRTEYRPGQECRAEVRVTDSKGRPAPDCEISLGVVDEAVFALEEDSTPDLREFFHRYHRPLAVAEAFFFKEEFRTFIVWKSPVFVRGQMNLYDLIGAGAGGGGRYGSRLGGRRDMVVRGGGGGMTSGWNARATFKDTAYWNAHLKTGADGTAEVRFAFPENLTSFRFTARGITRDHKVGSVRQQAVVRKPFYTRLAASRTVQEGNTLALSGLVHNYTDKPQSVRCLFRAPCPVLRSPGQEPLALQPGQVGRVEYVVSIDRYYPEAEFTFGAESDTGERDAVSVAVPGRRHGLPFHEGRSGSLAGGVPREEVFRVPAEAIRGTVVLKLDLDAGIHTAILEGLEPLIEYPYGCVEQTMSRFLPAVAADRALRGAPHRWSEKLPSVVAAGLQRLYQLQNSDGGWGWWGGGSMNDAMTAYVLYGLAQCKKAGVGVDRSAVERATKLLREHLEKTVFGSEPST